MKKIVAGLLCMCMLCGALGGCGAKEPPMTLPHNENIRLDMTRDEIVAVDKLAPGNGAFDSFYTNSDYETFSFLDMDCTVGYTFAGQYLQTYTIGPEFRNSNYDKEYNQFVKFFSKVYGKGTKFKDNPAPDFYSAYEATSWPLVLKSGDAYTIEVVKTKITVGSETLYHLQATWKANITEEQLEEKTKQEIGTSGYYDFDWGMTKEDLKKRETENFVFIDTLADNKILLYEIYDANFPLNSSYDDRVYKSNFSEVLFYFESGTLNGISVTYRCDSAFPEQVFPRVIDSMKRYLGKPLGNGDFATTNDLCSAMAFFETDSSSINVGVFQKPLNSFEVSFRSKG